MEGRQGLAKTDIELRTMDIRQFLPEVPLPTFERRATPRLPLELTIEFRRAQDEAAEMRHGITADISAGGVRFRTASWHGLQSGEEIHLRISGATHRGRGPLMRTLHATGRIVRMGATANNSDDQREIAVQFSRGPCFHVYRWCT